jgi:hypothetical protein
VIDVQTNLLTYLRPAGVSLDEFLSVLTRQFSSSVHDAETNFVLYPKDPPYELRVEFNKRGDLVGIFALSGMGREKLERTREDIHKEFVTTSGFGINREVFFSFYPVRGWWRYGDQFQILPLPPGAPTLPFLYGEHPFLVEYVYPETESGLINTNRRTRQASKLQLLLNAFLIPSIRWISPRHVGTFSRHWTRISDEPGELKVEYLQEFYYYKDSAPVDSFSPVEHLPRIVVVPPEEYYGDRQISTGEMLDLPSDLSFTLDRYFELDATLQDRFLHACYWLSEAHRTSSFSLMLLSAVQAIEALIRPPKGSKRCSNCGLVIGPGPTKLFYTFADLFLPTFMKANAGLQLIYKTRSALTHGSAPLQVDIGPMFGSLNPRDVEQRETVGEALRVGRMCLRNWLNIEPFIHDHTAKAAYFFREKDGCNHGRNIQQWLQAIAALRDLSFLDT